MYSPKMLPLPPPPVQPLTPPPQKTPLYQIVLSKQTRNQQQPWTPEVLFRSKLRLKEQPILGQPRRTNPIVWCCAILCLIFSLVLIFFGIATLIIFLAVKPRNPVVDIPAASLNTIYFDSPEFLNGDVTFLANFSNPNRKLDVRYEYLDLELYFLDGLIATQTLPPFTQKPGEVRLISIRLLSSLVYLPPHLALQLQKQVQRNRVVYDLRGNIRARANLGIIRFSYWLHASCRLEMTGPPTGVLIAHNCRTKR